MKGLFIPEITAEMFKNGCLESIEQLMAEGEIYDIDYPLEQEPCEDATLKDIFCMGCEYKEQEPILDKIRAEIEELDRYFDNDYFSGNNEPMYKCNEVWQIIDKYREGSEGE